MSLIAPETLLERLGSPDLRTVRRPLVADGSRQGSARLRGGALARRRFVDLDTDLAAPVGPGRHPLPSPAAFAARMAELGVDDDSDVVVYDDAGGTVAARLWWMLDDLGHPRVRVLDGGLVAWTTMGGPLTAEVRRYPPGRLTLRDRWTRTIDRDALAARLGSVGLIDARAPERYRGEVEPVDAVPGHIPTAVSRPTTGNLAPGGRFLDPGPCETRFVDLGDDVVSYCGSGVNACHNALAMRLAGLPDPLLYPGSYSDWAGTGMPIATGDEPGIRPPAP